MYSLSQKPLICASCIQTRICELAKQIGETYDYDIMIVILTGAFMFATDLSKQLSKYQKGAYLKEIAFIKASSYGASTNSSGKLKVSGIELLNLNKKKVLLIDDIADTGKTLAGVSNLIKNAGAEQIKTCVLLNKRSRRSIELSPDFVCFEIENEFVVGYGLDYAGHYRALPEIWTLQG